jgi:hypothetical protein
MAGGGGAGGGAGPLGAALQAQRHAEALQQQHAIRQQTGLAEPPLDPQTRQAVEAHIDGTNLSDHKKRFLRSHPTLLTEPYNRLLAHAYQMAMSAHIPDDTSAMDAAVLAGIHRDIEHHRQLSSLMAAHAAGPAPSHAGPTAEHQAQGPPPAQPHHDVDADVAELHREAEQHLAASQAAPTAPPPQPRPQRRSMPMQAPVSRDSPSVTGHRSQDKTLTADERQIAHVSMPHLPAAQAEYEYLQNRRRMREMKADGRIQGDG